MDGLGRRRAYVTILVAAFVSALLLGTTQQVFADNVIGSPSSITFNAGTSNSELKVKIVSNTAQSQSGDPVPGCNVGIKDDGLVVTVSLLISSPNLVASPNPIVFDECGKSKTVTLTSNVGGTYTITASAEDNDPRDGVYHLEPFGTITVIVVDTTPPETFLDSTPTDPTSATSASFEFHANEAGSTFECSLDGAGFTACSSPAPYSNLAYTSHTFEVRAIDPSGNVDATPASFTWTVKPLTIEMDVTTIDPPVTWGSPVTVQGTADVVDVTGLVVEVNWGDGTTTSDIAISGGSWGPVTHEYDDPGVYAITARLMDGATERASAGPTSVTMEIHTTSLDLVIPDSVTGGTGLNARGNLLDTSAGYIGVPGELITFDGTGATPSFQSVTTGGVTVTAGAGGMELTSCQVGPGQCAPEVVGTDSSSGNNIVLHVSPGSEIAFPAGTAQAALFIQDMDDTPFKYELWENTSPAARVECEGGGFECESAGGQSLQLVPTIGGPSSYTVVNGVRVFNGLLKLVITEVDGSQTQGSVGISAILTSNPNGKPLEQREINFEDMTIGVLASPKTFDGGSYSSIGIVQLQNQQGLTLKAHFAGNSHYQGSQSSAQVFEVQDNTNSENGIGGEGSTGDGFAASRDTCITDSDKDGICSTWEDGTVERSGGGSYTLFEPPAGDNIPDVYYELDCMTGYCPAASDLSAIKARFDLKGIKLHMLLDDQNLVVANPFHVWSDASATPGDSDGNPNNDFATVKNNKFGTSGERAGGTLGSGNNNLKAKLEVVRYLVSVQNINSGTNTACGTSGIAEFKGNDAVIAKGCGFGTNPTEETRGTMMHEIGHNLGLRHGGGDDVNCKVNQIGVMSYKGQVPTSLLPKPTTAQSGDGDTTVETVNQVPWILDYNREALSTLVESDVDDGFILNITPSKWIAADGKDIIGSFKIVWGTPQLSTKVQTGYTGATGINWDKDANTGELNQGMDLNYMSVTIGSKQVTACQPANSFSPNYSSNADTLTSYDEWAIVKANLNQFASYGSFDGVYTDPDFFPEGNNEIFGALDAIGYKFPGVDSPLNNVDLGSSSISKIKQGNTVPVKFDLFDGLGKRITGDNFESYHIAKSSTPIDHAQIGIQVALVLQPGTPPADNTYINPNSSTQTKFADFFTWDGNKWSFQMGTKNLQVNKTYAARITILIDTGENIVLDAGSDGITFLFTTVKNL